MRRARDGFMFLWMFQGEMSVVSGDSSQKSKISRDVCAVASSMCSTHVSRNEYKLFAGLWKFFYHVTLKREELEGRGLFPQWPFDKSSDHIGLCSITVLQWWHRYREEGALAAARPRSRQIRRPRSPCSSVRGQPYRVTFLEMCSTDHQFRGMLIDSVWKRVSGPNVWKTPS